MSTCFVSVIFPLALPKLYSYTVPDEMVPEIKAGMRVEVSLKNKLYSAIIADIQYDIKLDYKPKPIIAILDKQPLVTTTQIKFWIWMADYYCCTVGEVMNIALPSGLKLESETRVVFSGVADDMVNQLSDDEYLIAEAVSIRNELTISQIQEILNKKTIFPILRCLLDKNIISIKEELIEKFKQKMVNFMELNEPYRSRPDELTKVFDTIANSEKQTKALLAFVQLCRNKNFNLPVADVCHLAGVDSSVVKALAKKEIFTIRKQNQSRIHNPSDMTSEEAMSELSHIQDASLERIQNYFSDKKPVLLHGITGSGKTRIYTELILKNMELGKQTLYLLPEIALTTHMVTRLKKSFGADVQVYHSRMNNNERVEVWNAVLIGAKIIIAARSGLFLPYSNLGLIIVDEEHDPSYKQNDPNPRYNARDGAIYLSKMSGANIILGSATPSLESYSNTLDNKYGLVSITQRHGESVLPEIKIVDLKKEYKDQRFNGVFSHTLISAIQHTLSNKEQVLLFQNRRGYSPTVHCNICGWKAECTNCDVHLTLHKSFHELRCHYCGLRARVPMECPACGNHDLLEQGFGTEKIEEEITAIFPEATIKRMDLDTTKTKLAYEEIIQNFEDRKIDILVGTQMITKGLDFDNIALVGVLNADALLRYPDLRANERAFQLLTQVSGRAGRRAKQGLVIIQTYSPEHPIIIETMHHLYDKFFIRESNERKTFRYPPYFRMIQIELLHKNAEICAHAAKVYAGNISKIIGNRIIGPSVPSIGRIRGQYIQTITIKMEKDPKIVHLIKKLIMDQKEKLKQIASCKSVRVNIDVDPY